MRLSIRPEPEKPLLRVAGWYRASKQNYGWLGTSCKPADSTGVISSKAYTAAGREGLLKGKKAALLMVSGGVYDQGALRSL